MPGLAFLLSLVLVGCNPATQPRLNASRTLSEVRVSASLIAGAKANQYAIKVIGNVPHPEGWTLQRVHMGGPRPLAQIGKISDLAFEFLDTDVAAGEKFRYQLAFLQDADWVIHASTAIDVPLDVAPTPSSKMREIRNIARLFLDSRPLITEGRTLIIDVDEIIADSSVIESFALYDRAALGQKGRDGGLIVVRAKKARGRLKIVARGEQGGAGLPGAEGLPGGPGGAGKGGVALRIANKYHCITRPGDGGPGGPGLPGGRGGKGFAGGNSAKVYVDVKDPSDFRVEVVALPGEGGARGSGGKGGAGGPGGPRGPGDPDDVCRARSGPPGPNGPDGPEGDPGERGDEEAICYRLGSAVLGNCEAFPVGLTFSEKG